jgi:hypothetical protein
MPEKIFVIFINGSVYRKDSAIRTYKTRERAEREAKWFVDRDYIVEVGKFSAIDVERLLLK